MAYQLSIEVFGKGDEPSARSHWGFMIHQPPGTTGDLLHVRLIDLDRLWYEFESRSSTNIVDMAALGLCRLAVLSPPQRRRAMEVIRSEPPPRDGARKCQDWVFTTLISLEVDELVPAGTSQFWKGMVGRPAMEVKGSIGDAWTDLV
ncbi:hypothetical protein N7532_006777 [Penicillium argentinense]|uniref:Uncharacterized protein n=1 Tax=Penicillium argentinense TaxID=1131581 RepID=A0A9W9FGK4_9EURO|nr:uncharacterized protein N7532_006777 [Penicillium argentinense]KAJ5099776.1 hypothetical protein N7532_006777 [Penicillium argentinense]